MLPDESLMFCIDISYSDGGALNPVGICDIASHKVRIRQTSVLAIPLITYRFTENMLAHPGAPQGFSATS